MTDNGTKDCKPASAKRYWWKAIASFLTVLFTMPLGHALMIIMEHAMNETALHYSAFAMGAAGMIMVIAGVYAKGDFSAACCSGPDGWNFFSCTTPTATAPSLSSILLPAKSSRARNT